MKVTSELFLSKEEIYVGLKIQEIPKFLLFVFIDIRFACNHKMSISADLRNLNNLWMTEVHAPEILPYNRELVEYLKTDLDKNQVRKLYRI